MKLSFSGTRTPQLTQKMLFYQLHYSKACYKADLMGNDFQIASCGTKIILWTPTENCLKWWCTLKLLTMCTFCIY